MATIRTANGDVFEAGCEPIDVTSLHRPDTSWTFTDKRGHVHRWYTDGQPADDYRPTVSYDTPTLIWIKDGEEWWEDSDEPHDVGHTECRQCGERIEPGYTADTCRQFIAGLRWFTINDQPVSAEEFRRRYEALI
jgi:hypothetical protein